MIEWLHHRGLVSIESSLSAEPQTLMPVQPDLATVADLARRWRVSRNKVLAWIRRGELPAFSVASAAIGRPRWRIGAKAIEAFEQRRAAAPVPQPRRRPAAMAGVKDYYR